MSDPQAISRELDAMPDKLPPLALPAPFGRYRLVQLLAVGGMAEIYLAKSYGAAGFVKSLVVKRLDPALARDTYYTALFINEAKLLVTLNHGNIVPVFDFGRVDDDLFMAMEYVPGLSLHGLLKPLRERGERLDPLLAAYIGGEVCKGLDYAHRRRDPGGQPAGIIHRDVKPTNILLSFEGEVKIVDFGVAKLANIHQAQRQLAGTLSYMSPEQAGLQQVDPRTDVFSAGLVLHEMLSGQQPYRANSPQSMLTVAVNAQVPPLPDDVPRELFQVVERATARYPADRYDSANAMEQDLAEYLLLVRSAGAAMESISPASKLGGLIEALPGPDKMTANERAKAEADAPPTAPTRQEAVSLLDQGGPVDLDLINEAAKTFHSRVMTRVLLEQTLPQARKRRSALLVLLVGLLLAGSGIWIWQRGGVGARGGQAAEASDGGASTDLGVAREPASVSSGDAAVGELETSPPEGGLAEGGTNPRPDASASELDSGSQVTTAPPKRRRRRRARPVSRRTRARAAGYGYLSLNSLPWSRVKVDGKWMPRPTPLIKLRLRAGWHAIELHNDEQGLRKRIRVQVRANRTTTRLIRLR